MATDCEVLFKQDKDIKYQQGVYAVHVGDYVYIGSGKLGDRCRGNRNKLIANEHKSKQLQDAYNQIKKVYVEVLTVCGDDVKLARELENHFIDHFKRVDGFIVCNIAKAVVSKPYEYKLTQNDVKEIMKLIEEGKRVTDIANLYDISQSMISRIKSGVRWSKVTGIGRGAC